MKRDKEHIRNLLTVIQSAWEENPELRLGQLISNSLDVIGKSRIDIFYVEDRLIGAGLVAFLEKFRSQGKEDGTQ